MMDSQWGIAGFPSGESLIIRNSAVYASGSSAAICDFDGGLTVEGCDLRTPGDGKPGAFYSPAKTCTRGQVVTFLWRAAGK